MSAGATTSSASGTALDQQSTRDSYIPVFDGTPANYKEWRKRIIIYAKKMELMNRKGECVLNLLGSLQGTAWKLVEDFDLESVSGDTALKDILALLDAAFQYDSKMRTLPHTSKAKDVAVVRASFSSSPTMMIDFAEQKSMESSFQQKFKDGTCWQNPTFPRSRSRW